MNKICLLAFLFLTACAHRSEMVEKAMAEKAAQRAATLKVENAEQDVAIKTHHFFDDKEEFRNPAANTNNTIITEKTPSATEIANTIAGKPKAAEKSAKIAAKKPETKPEIKAVSDVPAMGVESEKARLWLEHGNTRYVKGHFRNDGKTKADRERLYQGQKPHTVILSCSDSRVPPELIFDQSLGEIFVIRVAGEALDSSVIGSIEYAVDHLGTKLVLVMGHSKCGAIAAAVSAKDGESAGSEALDKMVADIRPRIASTKASPDLYQESFDNAKGVAKDLMERSKILQEKVHSGQIAIRSAIYNMKTGAVEFE